MMLTANKILSFETFEAESSNVEKETFETRLQPPYSTYVQGLALLNSGSTSSEPLPTINGSKQDLRCIMSRANEELCN